MWGQLAIKAALSGVVIAAASELARRNPGWGGLVASLPLTTLLALVWLWRDAPDPGRAADFMLGTACYVVAALPSLLIVAAILRRGAGLTPALVAGALSAMAGYLMLIWFGRRLGLPV